MRVHKGNIVIEKKGIYAIENYILARRLMYMQVYLHKTVLSADKLIRNIFKRVRELMQAGKNIYHASPALQFFLEEQPDAKKGISSDVLEKFLRLDDNDVFQSVKYWQYADDPILSDLCKRFQSRSLFRTTFLNSQPSKKLIRKVKTKTQKSLKKKGLPYDDAAADYYFSFDESYSEAYRYENEGIWILESKDKAIEFSKAADTQNIIALTEPVVKPYVVHLKDIEL
jgi:HD superfamily phosphohydrolase